MSAASMLGRVAKMELMGRIRELPLPTESRQHRARLLLLWCCNQVAAVSRCSR